MALVRRIVNLFRRNAVDREIDQELASHIDLRIEANMASGMSSEQARRDALMRFGNPLVTRERTAEADTALPLEKLASDIRYALRQLLAARGFSLAILLTLALAIGVNTSVFTLVHAILLRQLPFDDPGRVFHLENGMTAGLGFSFTNGKDFEGNFKTATQSFKTVDSAALYATAGVNANLGSSNTPGTSRRLQASETSAAFFDVLGVRPELGRGFSPTEDIPGNDRVVLISDSLWREAFGADPKAIGSSIRLNGFVFAIIGILPARMTFPDKTDLWAPTIFDEHTALREGGAFFDSIVLRRKTNVSDEQLRAEFRARATSGSTKVAPDDMPELTPIASELTKSIRSTLLLVTGSVVLVLLIACANIAGLMLVRASTRRSEFAVRTALGAPRSRLVRQQLIESLLLSIAGGAVGVLVAHGALRALEFFRPAALASFEQPRIDGTVLAFTAAVAILTGIAFGVAPAWLAAHEDPIAALKARIASTSPASSRVRKTLVIAQISLAFVLLTGAGLLLRTLANLNAVPLGYSTEGIVTLSVSLHGAPYVTSEHSTPALASFYSSVLDRLRALPGVDAAAAIDLPPLSNGRADMLLPVSSHQAGAGRGSSADSSKIAAAPRFTSPGYFSLMGMTLQQGREFTSQDTPTGAPAVILTRDLADRLWPGESPLGKRLYCIFYCDNAPTVVGVVAPTRHYGPSAQSFPEFFFCFTQHDWFFMTFLVRTPGDPALLTGAVRKAVAAVDPTQPVYDIQTMRQRLNDNESLARFELFTLSVFAALATLLAVLGLYGVVSYTVTQHRRDIGIRIALGASQSIIRGSILREATLLAFAGASIGLLASLGLSRLLSATLFQVSAHDPLTLSAIFALFVLISIAATFFPANRAASVDPVQTLRNE
jgi:predicted permease